MADINSLIDSFNKTNINISGVSFAGKGLKLDRDEDAKDIVEAVNNCPNLEFLNLEGNTLGIEAAKSISVSLETHKEFKRALWKDMFTGRMKNEIPIALSHLGDGLVKSNARLVELDLSDNAFGPIGVKGLATLLKSSCCFALQELRLNNNGLGISGGELLANALLDCYNFSKKEGKPLALKVFIAGRNRLENQGAQFLAKVFKTIGTLEEIMMPQNGIYTPGIEALSNAFQHNLSLEIINLNDNTVTPAGAKCLAKVIPSLINLKKLNLGDCLLKTQGAKTLAESLLENSILEELILDSNEIKLAGGVKVVECMRNKPSLKKLSLNGNWFGDGTEDIINLMEEYGKYDVLDTLSDDEGEGDDEEEEGKDDGDETESVSDEEEEEDEEKTYVGIPKQATIFDFMQNSTMENYAALGENRSMILLKHATNDDNNYIDNFMQVIMRVSSLVAKAKDKKEIFNTCELLYRELLTWCQQHDKLSLFNNCLLVYLSLIKSEDKKFKPKWDIESCLLALENILGKNYLPDSTRSALKIFISKDIENKKDFINTKQKLLSLLS